MAFGSFGSSKENQPLAEINMIPMIDVMLVLLIIFIVTAPLLTHAVKIDLPRASNTPQTSQTQQIQIAIDATSKLYWNGAELDEAALQGKLEEAAQMSVQPEIHLHVDKSAVYDRVARFLSAAANRGLTKIAFVTDPTQTH